MNRRKLLSGSAALLSAAPIAKFNIARADAAPDANRLNQDLNPFGGIRAASASGYVPAWTGGEATPPAGWTKGMIPPDTYGSDQPLFVITQANMARYAAMLSEGQQLMFKHFGGSGWTMKVYPSHRSAAAPQSYYDNTFKNVTRAQPAAGGILQGFVGAVGGKPFPILSDDPSIAGAQAMLNHNSRWQGVFFQKISSNFVIGNGSKTMTGQEKYYAYWPYYAPNATPQSVDNGYDELFYLNYIGPPNQLGAKFQTGFSYDYQKFPNTAYEYLVGEGRIRQAPQAEYDIPDTAEADAANYDEANLFDGAIDRYNWKLIGTKEMIVGYNTHALSAGTPKMFGPQYLDPELTRWEIHRCQVVEASLAPGKRMTEPFRRFYFDEDTSIICLSDAYDAQGNYWKFGANYFVSDPQLPATYSDNGTLYNFQTQQYVAQWVFWASMPGGVSYAPLPVSMFSQQTMANSGSL